MRDLADAVRIQEFMRSLGRRAASSGRVYLVGGACAVLIGWRSTTIDIDLELSDDADALLRLIPDLKEELRVNVELASPPQFIPEVPGWRERSPFVTHEGLLDFFHYDFVSQALAKLERGHGKDLADVEQMIARRLFDPPEARRLFALIEPELYRYPAIDPASFRRRVVASLGT